MEKWVSTMAASETCLHLVIAIVTHLCASSMLPILRNWADEKPAGELQVARLSCATIQAAANEDGKILKFLGVPRMSYGIAASVNSDTRCTHDAGSLHLLLR